jgi:hypothetical protein
MNPNTQVRWSNGPLAGLTVECSIALAEELARRTLVFTPGGRLFDTREQRPVPGVRIVRPPTSTLPPPPAPVEPVEAVEEVAVPAARKPRRTRKKAAAAS